MLLNKLLKKVDDIDDIKVVDFDGKILIETEVDDDVVSLLNNFSELQYRKIKKFRVIDTYLIVTLEKDITKWNNT